MLLSICIPTKNRANVLQQSLESLTTQEAFINGSDIEIVISDNASEDHTPEMVQAYVERHPGKIVYHRNSSDIQDKNFEKSLRLGKGDFLKLANDSLKWLPGSLKAIKEIVEAARQLQPTLFFLNESRTTHQPIILTHGLNELLEQASFHITWIGGFGVWKNQLEDMHDFARHASLQLTQTDALLRLASQTGRTIIYNLPFCQVLPTGRKGGYNIAQVFGKNYLKILKQFSEQLSEETLKSAKRDVIENHVLPFFLSDDHDFGNIDIQKYLDDYMDDPYIINLINRSLIQKQQIRQQDRIKSAPALWRKINAHNETTIKNLFDFDKVKVGKSTYGALHVYQWGHPDERLDIGDYVSIADDVTFLLGGNHSYRGITTFPVKVKFLGHAREAQTKGAICVADDVWIGHNALILSGVHIGQGAIIAAGSVVNKDVPPYSIVAGNPARVVKYRFSQDVIDKLMKINFKMISGQHMCELGDALYADPGTEAFNKALDEMIAHSENGNRS